MINGLLMAMLIWVKTFISRHFDFDGDGTYDPDAGDAPGYGMDMSFVLLTISKQTQWGCQLVLDVQRCWQGSYGIGGEPMGIEVRAQSWVFSGAGPDFDNSTFTRISFSTKDHLN